MLFTLQLCKFHVHLPHKCSPVGTEKLDSGKIVQALSAVRELASHQTTLSKYGFLAKQRTTFHCSVDQHMCIHLFYYVVSQEDGFN